VPTYAAELAIAGGLAAARGANPGWPLLAAGDVVTATAYEHAIEITPD